MAQKNPQKSESLGVPPKKTVRVQHCDVGSQLPLKRIANSSSYDPRFFCVKKPHMSLSKDQLGPWGIFIAVFLGDEKN